MSYSQIEYSILGAVARIDHARPEMRNAESSVLLDEMDDALSAAIANDDVRGLSDLNSREFLVMALLALAVLYMGIYPKPFTDVMDASVADLLAHVAQSKLPQ
mgnify:CR=1 FL=1